MLATAADVLPRGAGWAYEFKWDGVRALLDVSAKGVRILSRRGNDVTSAYPELLATAATAEDALLDGEIVAFVDGRPSFKLEHLSAANGLAHEAAHDALSDVRATIALARLIRDKQPRLFDFALRLRRYLLPGQHLLSCLQDRRALIRLKSKRSVRA